MSKLRLRIFDGTRQPFAAPAEFYVTITDGNKTRQVNKTFTGNDLTFDDLPFFDNFGDKYTVLVSAKGYQQSGYYPVLLSNDFDREQDVMLVANDPGFSFVNARWPKAQLAYPFLGSGAGDLASQTCYEDLLDQQETRLACLLNLGEAMSQIALTQGTPLTYLKQIIWEGAKAPAQDRFFAWCDPELINQILMAPKTEFAPEPNPGIFHPGATRSWKQTTFGEANVQLTFHENEPSPAGTNWVMVEPDIDDYRTPKRTPSSKSSRTRSATASPTRSRSTFSAGWPARPTASRSSPRSTPLLSDPNI